MNSLVTHLSRLISKYLKDVPHCDPSNSCLYISVGLFHQIIESRLKVVLPEDLGSFLMDGVVLCHLANHVRPRSVASIHVPSPAVVRTLTLQKMQNKNLQ